jgi:sugar/nucleoside kinase (ribokinase family)
MRSIADTDYDVLCAGLIVADFVSAPIAGIPAAGELAMTDRIDLTIGGCASNVAVNLAKLGLRSCVAGRVGDDVFGRYVCAALEAQGARCDQVSVSQTAPTASTMIVNVQGEDRRFIHAAGANAEFTGREIAPSAVARSRVLYVGGFALNAALGGPSVADLFRAARDQGVVTVLDVVIGDPALAWPMLEPVLPLTDLFLPNHDEGRLITGLSDPPAQARRFRDAGAGTVVITCGPHGAWLVNAGGGMRIGAHHVLQVDATGGGDAFVAGYLYGLLKGCAEEACLRYGSAMGASCVRSMGATTGVFTAPELEEYVASHPLPVTPLR